MLVGPLNRAALLVPSIPPLTPARPAIVLETQCLGALRAGKEPGNGDSQQENFRSLHSELEFGFLVAGVTYNNPTVALPRVRFIPVTMARVERGNAHQWQIGFLRNISPHSQA
jgi:hypothetical protein